MWPPVMACMWRSLAVACPVWVDMPSLSQLLVVPGWPFMLLPCYFTNLRGCRGQSLLERGVDEKEGEGALSTCLQVMSGVQQRFFEQGALLGAASQVMAG